MAPRFIKDGMSQDRATIERLMAKVGRTPSNLDSFSEDTMQYLALQWIEWTEVKEEEKRTGLRFTGKFKYP